MLNHSPPDHMTAIPVPNDRRFRLHHDSPHKPWPCYLDVSNWSISRSIPLYSTSVPVLVYFIDIPRTLFTVDKSSPYFSSQLFPEIFLPEVLNYKLYPTMLPMSYPYQLLLCSSWYYYPVSLVGNQSAVLCHPESLLDAVQDPVGVILCERQRLSPHNIPQDL